MYVCVLCVKERESVCMCVLCVCVRESVYYVCMCVVCVCERESVCMCVCERVCVCMCVVCERENALIVLHTLCYQFCIVLSYSYYIHTFVLHTLYVILIVYHHACTHQS